MIRKINGFSREIQRESFKRCDVEETPIKSTLSYETLKEVLDMAYVVEDEFKM